MPSTPSLSPLCPAWSRLACPVVGMVHLRALPGSPGFAGPLSDVMEAALRDASLLEAGGVDGLMIENFGDVPFYKDRVPAETVAAMTRVAGAVRDAVAMPIGVNVLRNDGMSALAVASAVGASFIRVNVLSGTAVTDQGVIEGAAAQLMRYRAALGASQVRVMADVRVKHAAPLVDRPLQDEVEELVHRAGADALVVSGSGTGKPTDPGLLEAVAGDAPGRPVFVGSGVTCESVSALAAHAGGLIVGTGVKIDGDVANPVDPERVRELMRCVKEAVC